MRFAVLFAKKAFRLNGEPINHREASAQVVYFRGQSANFIVIIASQARIH